MIEFILLIQMILTLNIVFLLLYMLLTRNKKVTEHIEYSEDDMKTLQQYLNLLNYEGDPYDKEKSK